MLGLKLFSCYSFLKKMMLHLEFVSFGNFIYLAIAYMLVDEKLFAALK